MADTRLAACQMRRAGKGDSEPVLIPLTVPEVRRLVLVIAELDG